ncbi:MAG: cation-translocating P-type ATPase C-terminal domain-containing protein, partial [Oscillospiraceae bacterium]
DSLPAIAVGMEPAHDELLSQKPRDPKKSILTKDFITSIAVEGGIIGVFTMISYHIGLELTSPAAASTMAFATLTLARLFHGFNCRGRGSIFRLGLFTNPASIGAFLLGLLLLNSVLFIPFLQGLFSVAVLTTFEVCLIYLTAFMPTVIIQIYKVIREVREERR